jgi:hypothetical protein
MSFAMKTEDGKIYYLSICINCAEYELERDDDDDYYLKHIRCTAKELKPECENCSLIHPKRPKYRSPIKISKESERIISPKKTEEINIDWKKCLKNHNIL